MGLLDIRGEWCSICKRMVYKNQLEHRARHAEELERESERRAAERAIEKLTNSEASS
jgi:hypothetical protein